MTSREALDNSGDLRVEGGTFGFLKETLRGNLAGERARLAITVARTDAFDGAWHAQRSNSNPERDPFHDAQILTKGGLDISDNINWEASFFTESHGMAGTAMAFAGACLPWWTINMAFSPRKSGWCKTASRLISSMVGSRAYNWATPRPATEDAPWT